VLFRSYLSASLNAGNRQDQKAGSLAAIII